MALLFFPPRPKGCRSRWEDAHTHYQMWVNSKEKGKIPLTKWWLKNGLQTWVKIQFFLLFWFLISFFTFLWIFTYSSRWNTINFLKEWKRKMKRASSLFFHINNKLWLGCSDIGLSEEIAFWPTHVVLGKHSRCWNLWTKWWISTMVRFSFLPLILTTYFW